MRAVRSHELDGFFVHLKSFAPNYRCRWPEKVPGRLCVFLQGQMHERKERYGVSDLVYKPPEDRPELRFGDRGARTITVELRRPGIEALRAAGFDVERPLRLRSFRCHQTAERIRGELTDGDEMSSLVLEGLVYELFSTSHRSSRTNAPRWLRAVYERVETSYARRWTLRDYARDAGVHPVRLAERFRAHFGVSVGEQIRAFRVRHGMRELVETRKPIGEIALEAGFSDQSHLTRVFKKLTGLTPSEYRKRG